MKSIHDLFINMPLLALFITIALGYVVGKFKIKNFVLGGIAGSLLIGVLVGQLDIKLPEIVGSVFFALFIYAVGYQGGPQFFRSLRKDTAIQLISAVITCLLGLGCVLLAAWYFHLDRGTAAGLAAGGLTQSAMIGTASDAISKLSLSTDAIHTMQSNVAVGYAVTYIFGSFGPILLLAAVFPAIMRWNLRAEAKKLAQIDTQGEPALEPGQFFAISDTITRVYLVSRNSPLVGQPLDFLTGQDSFLAIESLIRDGKSFPLAEIQTVEASDLIAITGDRAAMIQFEPKVGTEIARPENLHLVEEARKFILSNPNYHDKTVQSVIREIEAQHKFGVYVTEIHRLGEPIAPSPTTKLKRGDEIVLVGKTQNLDIVEPELGYRIPANHVTDFIFFGLGMSLGYVLGMISFSIFGVSVTLGAGVGCLFSGLIFGWLRSTHPRYAALPTGASNFLRDFGLAAFVAAIGITAGPEAIKTIKQYGLELFFLGVGVTLIPQILSFFISYYFLKIKNPIVLLATIAGGRSANPGFAALLEKAGNSTPVVPFTATYAVANILLTLWGPIVVGLIPYNV